MRMLLAAIVPLHAIVGCASTSPYYTPPNLEAQCTGVLGKAHKSIQGPFIVTLLMPSSGEPPNGVWRVVLAPGSSPRDLAAVNAAIERDRGWAVPADKKLEAYSDQEFSFRGYRPGGGDCP